VDTEGAVISTSADTSLSGQFYDMLEEFSTHMQSAMDQEEILLRRPWTDEEGGRTYFRLKGFRGVSEAQQVFRLQVQQDSPAASRHRRKGRTVPDQGTHGQVLVDTCVCKD
jgi:hypothetical protein